MTKKTIEKVMWKLKEIRELVTCLIIYEDISGINQIDNILELINETFKTLKRSYAKIREEKK